MDHKNKIFTKYYVACDHAGLPLKKALMELHSLEWVDLGTMTEDSVDYPDYANKLAKEIKDEKSFGLLICGSGQGVAIAANRHPHIRAAVCWNEEITKLSREHNNANVLCLGARLIPEDQALKIINVFLNTDFLGGRHARRVEKLSQNP